MRESVVRRRRRERAPRERAELDTYRAKRDFGRTPEPRGAAARKRVKRLSFVIQKHAASRMHHDFRLELDGVLLSWAVPKGPPSEPGGKALAVRVEDHPLEYADFEGVIPKGEYGGGTVMLWDRGTWRPEGDPRAALDAGRLSFELAGERLRGRWTLVRTGGRERGSKENWLLVKRSDTNPDAHTEPAQLDRSVATGRTMRAIAAEADRTWTSAGEQENENERRRNGRVDPAALTGARRAAQPKALEPQLATLTESVPEGDDWLHELKYDGYRLLAFRDGKRVRLRTRRGNDWTERFPTVAEAIAALPVNRAVLDGEVVVLDSHGASDFQALQNSLDRGEAAAHVFFAFDLPFCEGYDLRASPLAERKALLARLLARSRPSLRFSEHVRGSGPDFLRQACELGLEGTVAKRADSRYESRRTRTWLKLKCLKRQEFVVGGYTEGTGSRARLGALLLGVHGEDGELRYAGKVGTGFTARSLRELASALAELEIDEAPFVDPPRGREARGAHWAKPDLVVEIAFTEWTADGSLRHPSFQGMREDKGPEEVVRERPRESKGSRSAVTRDGVAGVELSHPDRVLYPEQGITKAELAAYYESVADAILPHLVDRPLTIVRCPRGRAASCFYQKHANEGIPAPVRAIRVTEQGGAARDYLAVDDLAGVVTLVQLGALELHPWGSRADRIDRPDRIVIDLDPGPGVPWKRVVEAAAEMRAIFEELELASFLRTTGGKGLHVVLPIDRRSSWDEAKDFAREAAAALARRDEEAFVLTATKARRQGRIFVDWLRNARGATAVASYSSRARPGAPVAMPIAWKELAPKLDPSAFTVRTVPRLLARRRRDPWEGFFDLRQSLTKRVREGVREV